MKCISVGSWFKSIVSTTCHHRTLNTQSPYSSPIKIGKLSKIVSDWYHCLNVMNGRNNLRELTKFSLAFNGFIQPYSGNYAFPDYVNVNYSYCLHRETHSWSAFLSTPYYTFWRPRCCHTTSVSNSPDVSWWSDDMFIFTRYFSLPSTPFNFMYHLL
jgi:hypothetical protein